MLQSMELDNKVFSTQLFMDWTTKVILSMPTIRKKDNEYRLAYFVFPYNGELYGNNESTRPTYWLECDINSGDLIDVFDCMVNDFVEGYSDFNKIYDIGGNAETNVDDDYFIDAFKALDVIRSDIIETHTIEMQRYQEYKKMVLKATPNAFKVFYQAISI